jgi:tRNA modification GTPase
MDETIAAIASPVGTGAVSLIRLSGSRAHEFAALAIGFGKLPNERAAGLRRVRDRDGLVIDEGVMVCFKGPRSYTGEDIVEFTGHGGVMVTRKVLERFIEVGARAALPGEFPRRILIRLLVRHYEMHCWLSSGKLMSCWRQPIRAGSYVRVSER